MSVKSHIMTQLLSALNHCILFIKTFRIFYETITFNSLLLVKLKNIFNVVIYLYRGCLFIWFIVNGTYKFKSLWDWV